LKLEVSTLPSRSINCVSKGEILYLNYDKWVKRLESQVGSTISASGSIYAIRKHLFVPISDPAQADDFAISARVITQGYRLVFESGAISYEDPPIYSRREFRRKVRVANQSIHGILNLKQALCPWHHGFYAIELLLHKVLRYSVQFFLIIVFAANVVLALESGFYKFLLLGQLLFYGSSLIGYKLRYHKWGRIKLFYGPLHFCLANTAAFLGVLSLLRGERITTWRPELA